MVGHGGTDLIRHFITNVINVIKKKRGVCTSPCDGMILKMHYQWTFWMLLCGFTVVWYALYHRDLITCVSHFNADSQIRLDHTNICLSYPFVHDPITQERRYLLFYRWVHLVLLLMAGVYYIPRKFSKNSENPRLKKLLEDMAVNSSRYDHMEKDTLDRAAHYIAYNLKTHNGLYFKFLACNMLAFFIDVFTFRFFDFVFQDRFAHYGWRAYPYSRTLSDFSDYMSQTFPPFAKCEIGPTQRLLGKRTEIYGCHLIVMELYEKVFLILWLWLVVLMISTCAYIVFLFFMFLPNVRLTLLKVSKPVTAKAQVTSAIMDVLKNCKIGDVYVLYRMRQHLSHARFYELLLKLGDEEYLKTMSEDILDRALIHSKNQDNLNRSRKAGLPIGGMGGKGSIPNTSIYIG